MVETRMMQVTRSDAGIAALLGTPRSTRVVHRGSLSVTPLARGRLCRAGCLPVRRVVVHRLKSSP